ncbi:hypothetical protein B0H13DRAFT_1901024 [Mycena leptocephala]|nr:hypothetical protein B0H13DRAFT_1901024 [Mycena leptocephala]
MALPLGALLCFFNLLGVPPYPPRPIFTRMREPLVAGVPVPETSFYKNAYAMFTDPTSYQALFYFLVVKPSITLLLSLGLLVVGVPAIILVGPRHGVPCNPESRHLAGKRRGGGLVDQMAVIHERVDLPV